MRCAAISFLLVAPIVGQSWSLASRLAAPTLYVAVDTAFVPRLREVVPDSAVLRVLRESRFELPFAELSLLGRVTELCQGTMEVALGGSAGTMVVHCELPAAAAAKVQALIDDDRLVERIGEVAGVPIVALRPTPGAPDEASLSLCMALSVGHLIVASSCATVRTLLGDEIGGRTLADDADFRELSRRVEGDRPALTLYGSLAELRAAISPSLEHASKWLSASGYVDARSLLIAVRPCGTGLLSSVLMRRSAKGALDGWLAWGQRVPLQTLLAELPRGGLGSMTLAFAPDLLRKREADSVVARFYDSIAGGCAEVGLNLEQQVLQRLKGVAGVQFVATPRVGSAYVAKAKSERDAQRLMTEFRRVFADRARLEVHQAGEELVLPANALLHAQPRLGTLRDAVMLSTEHGVLEQVALADRASGDSRTPPRWVSQAIKNLPGSGRQTVTGAVVLDLSPLLPEAIRATAPLRQHAGCILIRSDHIRLELFSQL